MKISLKGKTTTIRKRMIASIWICILPILILFTVSVVSMYRYYQEYDQLVTNITSANVYNTRFKNDIDESMYKIIIGSANWTNSEEKLQGEDPKGYIREAEAHFRHLQSTTEGVQVRTDLKALLKLMTVLEERVDDILVNVEEGGHYDENLELLDLNIRTLTDLIQEDIQIYIYDEVTSMETLRKDVSAHLIMTIRILIILLLGILAYVIFVSRSMANRITQPVTELCESTDRFAGGDFSVRYHTDSSVEIRKLADSFNDMVSEIGVLVEDIRLEQKNAKDAELRLLQEQINPHFLYNTLDTIIWLTEAGEKKEAVEMTQKLSAFFRTTLSKGRDLVRVREEQAHITSYLEIQQFRYRDIMKFEIAIDEEIRDCQIQKLTLQPIIENALYHGIKNKRGGGTIRVTGKAVGDRLHFEVCDDGIGMKEEELEKLRDAISDMQTQKAEQGFGMANVRARIAMQYGSEYGLEIDSVYNQGTKVIVEIPMLPYSEDGSGATGSVKKIDMSKLMVQGKEAGNEH